MSYQTRSLSDLLSSINANNATTFTEAQLTFGVPQVINGTWRGLANPHNTAVRVTAVPGGDLEGTAVVTYDRFKLDDLAHIPGFALRADNPATVHDLFDGLLYYNGLRLGVDDVENSAVTVEEDGTYTATLTAKPGSLGWIGSKALAFSQGGAALDVVLATADLPGLNYPTASDQDVFADLYLYGYNFTEHYAELLDFEEAEEITSEQAVALKDMIQAVDISSGKNLWNTSLAQTEWSLAGAVAFYNGINTAELATNPAYKYVLILKFRQGVTVPAGRLIFHYNDPVDSGSV